MATQKCEELTRIKAQARRLLKKSEKAQHLDTGEVLDLLNDIVRPPKRR
jgi:hypothetical protein